MHSLGKLVPFVVLLSAASATAVDFRVDTGSVGANSGWTKQFRRALRFEFTNPGEASAEFSWTVAVKSETASADGWAAWAADTPSSGSTTVLAGQSDEEYLGELIANTRRDTGAHPNTCDWEVVWEVTVIGTGGVTLASFDLSLYGVRTSPGGTPGPTLVPAFEQQFTDGSPLNQVSYHFFALNESGAARELGLVMHLDGAVAPWNTYDVPATEGPHEFEGSFLAPAEHFSLLHPGGTLMEGVGAWSVGDGSPWQAGILFSGALPEEIRVRMRLEVFTEDPLTLNILDEGGIVVGSVDLEAGVYAQQVDVPILAEAGSELTFAVSGADGYAASPVGETSVEGGGVVNVIPIRVHADDDIPVVSGSTTSTVVDGGQTSSITTSTVGNTQGTITNTSGNQQQQWNPVGGATTGQYYTTTTPGGAEVDTLARIDAEIGSVGASGVLPQIGDGEAHAQALGESASAFGDGILGMSKPGAQSFGSESTWVVEVPAIFGYSVPSISIPVTHPVVPVIRSILLVASSLWWLFRGIALLRS